MKQNLNFLQLTLALGSLINIPSTMTGHMLYANAGLVGSISSILLGLCVVYILAAQFLRLSFQSKLDITGIGDLYLTIGGNKLMSFFITIATTAWFGVQVNFVSNAIYGIMHNHVKYCPDRFVLAIFIGIFMTFLVYRGLKFVDTLVSFATVAVLSMLFYSASKIAYQGFDEVKINIGELDGMGVTYIFSSFVVSIVCLPNYFRFSRSMKDSYISVFLTYAIGGMFVGSVGVILAIFEPHKTFIAAITQHSDVKWEFFAVIFILLSGWVSNSTYLYYSSIALMKIFVFNRRQTAVVILGCAGTLFGSLDLIQHFGKFLTLLGVTVGSCGMMILFNFAKSRFKVADASITEKKFNFIGIVFGVGFGWLRFAGVVKFGVPIVNALVFTLFCLAVMFIINDLILLVKNKRVKNEWKVAEYVRVNKSVAEIIGMNESAKGDDEAVTNEMTDEVGSFSLIKRIDPENAVGGDENEETTKTKASDIKKAIDKKIAAVDEDREVRQKNKQEIAEKAVISGVAFSVEAAGAVGADGALGAVNVGSLGVAKVAKAGAQNNTKPKNKAKPKKL